MTTSDSITTGHYITCNGNVEVIVIGDPEFAKGVMKRMIKDHKMFNMPDYWNLRSVPVISEPPQVINDG